MDLHNIINWSDRKLVADNHIPLSDYYCLADELLQKALIFEEQGKHGELYITLIKYSRLCIEIIPYHKDYRAQCPEQAKLFREKVMLSMDQLLSLETVMKYRGIDLSKAFEDPLAFLKRKEQGHPVSNVSSEHLDTSLFPLIPYEELAEPNEPSAPPIPDSPRIHSPKLDSTTVENRAKTLADFEVHGEQVVDYKGRGLVDKVYVPLLEEVCHDYPYLIECQRNRTPKYVGWAFTALGRVLHFLENTKVADMVNEEACECLQLLWDEVQVFGFGLSWLAPQVEFALKIKGYMEKVKKVTKHEEEKRSLEVRIQELSMRMIESERELENSKGDLANALEELGDQQVETERTLRYRRHPAPYVVCAVNI